MELSAENIADLKKSLLYNPTLIHYEIYAREANQEFFHFEKLQASFEKAIEDIKDRKFGQKGPSAEHRACCERGNPSGGHRQE